MGRNQTRPFVTQAETMAALSHLAGVLKGEIYIVSAFSQSYSDIDIVIFLLCSYFFFLSSVVDTKQTRDMTDEECCLQHIAK